MKTHPAILISGLLCLNLISAYAQPGARAGGMGGPAPSPGLSAATARLFGDNPTFSSEMEMQAKGGPGDVDVAMPGKFAFDNGKSRFEMDLAQMKSSNLPAEAVSQMKAMGMDKMIMISRPDKKVSYLVYPSLQSYVVNPLPERETE
ncbi:MAG TPA: hypothetical protein VEC99_08485, partial [Clostridia bacterium]|nr:hypothetical protein [Clostridia bacterium]